MKVFLSAYACEPGKGSEPGVGWRWAGGLAERVELLVLTRESNRTVIEQAVSALPVDAALRSARFHYHDLSGFWLWAKRRGLLPTMAYYALWQWSISRKFAHVAETADVVHHLTFCTLLCPGFWHLKHAAFVLGPVGAPQVNPYYLPLFGAKAWQQRLRGWILERFLDLPWLRRLLRDASAVVPANTETRELLVSRGIPAKNVLLDTGAPSVIRSLNHSVSQGTFRLIYAGQLERRKGLELSLRALTRVANSGTNDCHFDILGEGPDLVRLRTLTAELGIGDKVKFHGALPQTEVMRRFQNADAFLFTSVRDTSGGVNLEAMAHGLPIICIAHQGVADITDSTCAERIEPGPIPDTIEKIAVAIIRLANDPQRRITMGACAAKRAELHFSWDEKFDRMCSYYQTAVSEKQNSNTPSTTANPGAIPSSATSP
jgi:glycosyltransferase involved in cell wall biosynthesis